MREGSTTQICGWRNYLRWWRALSRAPLGGAGGLLAAALALALGLAGAAGCGGGDGRGSGGAGAGSSSSASGAGVLGDFDPPEVTIVDPPRGAYLSTDRALVRGRALDAGSGIVTLDVNGIAVTPSASGDWQVSLPLSRGVNTIVARALDRAGNAGAASVSVIYGDFRLATEPIFGAAASRVREPALNALAPAVAQAVAASGAIQRRLTSAPLYDGSVQIFGVTVASARVDVLSVSFDAPAIGFDAVPGGVLVAVRVPNLRLWARAHGTAAGISYAATGWFDFGIKGIPAALTNIVESAVEREAEDRLASAIAAELLRELARALAGLGQPIPRTWNGRTVTFRARPTPLLVVAARLRATAHVTIANKPSRSRSGAERGWRRTCSGPPFRSPAWTWSGSSRSSCPRRSRWPRRRWRRSPSRRSRGSRSPGCRSARTGRKESSRR